MKKLKKILSVALTVCLIAVSLIVLNYGQEATRADAAGETVASISFASGGIVANNMTLVQSGNPGDEQYTEPANIGGVNCRKIPSSKFMYLICNKNAVPSSARNLMISITYFDNNGNDLWFNYNATSEDYKVADFKKNNSQGWATTVVAVTDANFRGTMNGGGDFRMGFNLSDNYIKEIKISFGTLNPDAEPIPAKPNNPKSEFKNKSFAGYQIWHEAGNNPADWVHWSYGKLPAAGSHINVNVASFPDLSEYADEIMYKTNLAPLGNGRETKLYNSKDAVIINKQFEWLKAVDFDGVAVQRFVGDIGKTITQTEKSHLTNVKNAAEATGRLFYICYDLNGSDPTIVDRMKRDWVYEIEQTRALTSSPNYATVNGKPVVEIWGIGGGYVDNQKSIDIINFFKSRGCYVIGGVPRDWRTHSGGGTPSYAEVYKTLNAVSPWTVGVYGDIAGANNYLNNYMVPDKAYCNQNGLDYLPVVFAGSGNWLSADGSFSEVDREGGKLLWQQVLNAKSIGQTAVYYAMLDEFEENTNLINSAVDYFDIPTDQYFETLAKDGVWTSSDYYLRLAAAASKMLRGEIPQTQEIQIPYSNGPLYFRNSFESRYTTFKMNNATLSKTMKIDPCFYKNALISQNNVSNGLCDIITAPSNARKTGDYVARISGTANNSTASYYYKMSEVKIKVKPGMTLSYWKYCANENGRYTGLDLQFSDGTRLSQLIPSFAPSVPTGETGQWKKISYQIGQGSLTGKDITGILAAYDKGSAASFTAYFDDVIIETAETEPCNLVITEISTQNPVPLENEDVSFYAVLRNTGNGPSPAGNHTVVLTVDGRDFETAVHLSSIPAGGYTVVNFNKKWKAMVGVRTVRAYVNAGKTIPETNYADNLYAKKIKVMYQ